MQMDRSTTQRKDPLLGFRFKVHIGNEEYGFSKISGLRRERENFTFQEGGLNDRVHILPGPTKQGGTLRLERGVYAGEDLPFYLVGEPIPEVMTIELEDHQGGTEKGKLYQVTGLVVRAWEAGELDANQNQILIDRMELDYEFLQIKVR